MSARHASHRSIAVLVALLIALAALPVAASASPALDVSGGTSEPSTPAPTVVRTVVKEEAAAVLPIALAGAALLIAIAGTGYAAVRMSPMRARLRGEH
jgi:hypothetical protein